MIKYEEELLNILESNIQNKAHYIKSLTELYPTDKAAIFDMFEIWQDLGSVDIAPPSEEMDNKFYQQLSEFEKEEKVDEHQKVIPLNEGTAKIFTLKRLGIAMTFLLGMAVGNFLGLFSDSGSSMAQTDNQPKDELVRFASLEETPLAGDRIKGIINAKNEINPNQRILAALNEVLCNDPNVNVRLSAIETLVLFWDIPKAREILIKAIPKQDSPIVQMELADVMISLEAKNSSNKWNQLLTSGSMEPDIKQQLENTLKELL